MGRGRCRGRPRGRRFRAAGGISRRHLRMGRRLGAFRAVDTAELALVPDGIDLGATAALPVAAVTALQAVRRLGSIVSRRVLVTGASGGVGRFAVQLAYLAGADVIASVGSPERGRGLTELGAADVIVGPDVLTGRIAGAIDNVGGQQLADAYYRLEAGGTVVAVGMASKEPTTIDFEAARINVDRGRIETFVLTTPLGKDLEQLIALTARGRLSLPISWRGDWHTYPTPSTPSSVEESEERPSSTSGRKPE